MNTLTIGKLASASNIGIETIRFYERRGLLPAPPRSAAGYRCYPESTVQRLQFIHRAKALGFSLDEIATLLALHEDTRDHSRGEVKAVADSKLLRHRHEGKEYYFCSVPCLNKFARDPVSYLERVSDLKKT